jgi:hypothetical protein
MKDEKIVLTHRTMNIDSYNKVAKWAKNHGIEIETYNSDYCFNEIDVYIPDNCWEKYDNDVSIMKKWE